MQTLRAEKSPQTSSRYSLEGILINGVEALPHSIRGWVPGACGESEGAGWPGQSTPYVDIKLLEFPFQGGEIKEEECKFSRYTEEKKYREK